MNYVVDTLHYLVSSSRHLPNSTTVPISITHSDMQPSSYVVVKGSCQFVQEELTEVGLAMGLENGVISLVARTYQMSEIFVNCNHFTEEMIFSHEGELQQGIHVWRQEMQQIIGLATEGVPEQQLHGGIFYMHANIPQGEFNYKQAFLIALYLSVMLINQNLHNFTIDQMINKISQLKFVGSKEQIQRCFKGYRNREFSLTLPGEGRMGLGEIDLEGGKNGGGVYQQEWLIEKQKKCNLIKKSKCYHNHKLPVKSQYRLPMTQQYKLIFCKLDLATADLQYELNRRQQLLSRKHQLLTQMSHKYKINGLFELLHKLQNELTMQDMHFESIYQKINPTTKSMHEIEALTQQEQILYHPNKFITKLLTQTHLVNQFSKNNINLQQLTNRVWQINSKDLKIHSSNVVELVQNMKDDLGINGCMIINRNFLLIVVNKHNFTDLLCDIKDKMSKGELKSKSLFQIDDEECLQHRWASDKVIGERIFSSVPAHGVGIFDPSESIWYD